jgi:hypothetical protein
VILLKCDFLVFQILLFQMRSVRRYAAAVLCGDPLIQAGQAFMPRYLLPDVPRRRAARQMAGLLQTVGGLYKLNAVG